MSTAFIAKMDQSIDQASAFHHAMHELDNAFRETIAVMSGGVAPISLAKAYTDWLLNLSSAPGTQLALLMKAIEKAYESIGVAAHQMTEMQDYFLQSEENSNAQPADQRFSHPTWKYYPWAYMAQTHQSAEAWWKDVTNLRGMSDHSKKQMDFYVRQILDAVSPSNSLATNPHVLETAIQTNGQSLLKGFKNRLEELRPKKGFEEDAEFVQMKVGRDLAVTPGKVVMRNHLVELIQYEPTTSVVNKEPLLIVPSCILKYYILDLRAENSMVKWLVDQGHTVFMVSWRNPDRNDSKLTMDDYVRQGVIESLNYIYQEVQTPVHLVGYCLGGTFSAIAAASICEFGNETVIDGEKIQALAGLTLLAAETDFTELGELGVFIDEAQIEALESLMSTQGYLSGKQMAKSFQALHARDLIWLSHTKSYLLGETNHVNDLMTWNGDLTRLPAKMHGQYLRSLYLHNDLAEGRFILEGHRISLKNINIPLFVVGTTKDHVSPWKSVFKVHQLVSGDVTFVLTNGGHNAGIVSEPGHKNRRYQIKLTPGNEVRHDPESWAALAGSVEGSWWQSWNKWLLESGQNESVPARRPVSPLSDAPGEYVLVRYED